MNHDAFVQMQIDGVSRRMWDLIHPDHVTFTRFCIHADHSDQISIHTRFRPDPQSRSEAVTHSITVAISVGREIWNTMIQNGFTMTNPQEEKV